MSHDQRAELDEYCQDHVLPVLTPLAVDPAHPFPYISGLSLNLAVMVESPDKVKSVDKSEGRFVRLKVPPVLPGLIPIEKESKFALLSAVIAANLGALFPGMHTGPAYEFRVTRDADIDIREYQAEH